MTSAIPMHCSANRARHAIYQAILISAGPLRTFVLSTCFWLNYVWGIYVCFPKTIVNPAYEMLATSVSRAIHRGWRHNREARINICVNFFFLPVCSPCTWLLRSGYHGPRIATMIMNTLSQVSFTLNQCHSRRRGARKIMCKIQNRSARLGRYGDRAVWGRGAQYTLWDELCLITWFYYMALACGRYNARFDWLIVTEL